MSADLGLGAVESFLRWAREVLRQDPGFRGEVEKAFAETTLSPELRRKVELELARIPGEARKSEPAATDR